MFGFGKKRQLTTINGVVERIGIVKVFFDSTPVFAVLLEGESIVRYLKNPYGSHVSTPIRGPDLSWNIAADWAVTVPGDRIEMHIEMDKKHAWLFEFNNITMEARLT